MPAEGSPRSIPAKYLAMIDESFPAYQRETVRLLAESVFLAGQIDGMNRATVFYVDWLGGDGPPRIVSGAAVLHLMKSDAPRVDGDK